MVSYLIRVAILTMGLLSPVVRADPVDGIRSLANRLFNGQGDSFEFVLDAENEAWSKWNPPINDKYTVTGSDNGKIRVEGSSKSALARGLRHYATDILQLDEFWFVDTYKKAPSVLPSPKGTLSGSSVVPWRYNLNTVTFSYSFVWYSWEDWEKLLDWAAWRGTNLQLAWVGYEKIFLDSFRDLGMTNDEIVPFFSGPAFQAWNRFGNTQASWGEVGNLTMGWIEGQFNLQKKIVARMVELGITPVLPAFPGFVPKDIQRVRPNANITQAPEWSGVGDAYSTDTFLSPLDEVSAELQKLFISKQIEAFGNITNIYTLDQFNEISPASGDVQYLGDISTATYKAVTDANPAAVWLLQGWLFYNDPSFWTQDRIDAYLGGVDDKNGMLILDLYSENEPQWQRTQSYSGKSWIWCQLHDFGGNMGLYGQATNITVNPIEALKDSGSLVGFGLTPEGYEGNEVIYDLLLDQAWSATPINKQKYFHDWATRRYAGDSAIPSSLYQAWDLLGKNVYDNLNPEIPCTGVSIYELAPSLSGLVNRTGHYPAPTKLQYSPEMLKKIYSLFWQAATENEGLLQVPAFQLDLVDIMRQVMGNSFIDMYTDLVQAYDATMSNTTTTKRSACKVTAKGKKLLDFLELNDFVLSVNEHFTFQKWLNSAQSWADDAASEKLIAFSARSQVTVWDWVAESLNDYAAKGWSGLIGSYYVPRWNIFVNGLINAVKAGSLNETALNGEIRAFEKSWQYEGFSLDASAKGEPTSLKGVVDMAQKKWPEVFPAFS